MYMYILSAPRTMMNEPDNTPIPWQPQQTPTPTRTCVLHTTYCNNGRVNPLPEMLVRVECNEFEREMVCIIFTCLLYMYAV